MSSADAPAIEMLDTADPRRDDALRLLLSGGDDSRHDIEQRVRWLNEHLTGRPGRSGTVLGASLDGRLVSTAILLESPGRLGVVVVPTGPGPVSRRGATVALLRRAQEVAWRRSLGLLQILVDRDAPDDDAMFGEAGFDLLAKLIYMERSASDPCPHYRAPAGLQFVPYTPQAEALFVTVLDLTYQDSGDCPQLTGVRRTEEVLATHRATGVHDPAWWLLAMLGNQPAGVLLLAGVEARPAFEVVYMGVVPEFRGRGVGHAMLARAADLCRRNQRADLTLAVDSTNEPARRLYEGWSLHEVGRRYAWFAANPRRSRAGQGL